MVQNVLISEDFFIIFFLPLDPDPDTQTPRNSDPIWSRIRNPAFLNEKF
jgi:hypothetical protein